VPPAAPLLWHMPLVITHEQYTMSLMPPSVEKGNHC
jgi:hypothetical protein